VSSDERRRILKNILRLRRAEEDAPESREIVAVRSDLERQLGGTVSRAAALRARDLAVDSGDAGGHRAAELRGLAYHRVIARRLDRPMIEAARHQIWQWEHEGRIEPARADRWAEVLRRPLAEVRELIISDTSAAAELRQASPFAGRLSEPERRRILELVG